MLAVVGTIPDPDFPLVAGEVTLREGHIQVEGRRAPVNRGTPALIAAAVRCLEVLGLPMPYGYLAGDIGLGGGSRRLYERLVEDLPGANFRALTFHYLQPDVDWHNKVLFAVGQMRTRPVLIADAGFMYAAKMSGLAEDYDLFTPDAGELAFLADEEAPHPFYTRGFILHEDHNIPELIRRAYEHCNAARRLLVKGRIDYVAGAEGVIATVDSPSEEALEPIGGTGDTLTGILSALICGGFDVDRAALLAARANRIAGRLASPTPMTQVNEIIAKIPQAMAEALEKRLNDDDTNQRKCVPTPSRASEQRVWDMELLFVCPLRQETFSSADFEIIDNRGIAVDPDGNRYLNARIRLAAPCPICGEYHEYHASELACPFSANHEG